MAVATGRFSPPVVDLASTGRMERRCPKYRGAWGIVFKKPNDTPTIPHSTYNSEYPMNKRKTRRSRCANESCGKQFRHADPGAKACSSNCKQVLYRINRKRNEEDKKAAAEIWRRLVEQARQRRVAEAERSATARHVEEGSPPAFPLYHLVDADKLGRCGVYQLGEDLATSLKEFITLARMGVDLCKGCVGAVNRALEPRWIGGSGPLGTRAPEAGVITIGMPKRPPMTPLNSRR